MTTDGTNGNSHHQGMTPNDWRRLLWLLQYVEAAEYNRRLIRRTLDDATLAAILEAGRDCDGQTLAQIQ